MSNSNTTKNKEKAARKAAIIGLLCAAFLAIVTGLMITGILLASVQSHEFHIGQLKMPAVIPAAIGILLLVNFIEYDSEEEND